MLHALREQHESVRKGVLIYLLSHRFPLATSRVARHLSIVRLAFLEPNPHGVAHRLRNSGSFANGRFAIDRLVTPEADAAIHPHGCLVRGGDFEEGPPRAGVGESVERLEQESPADSEPAILRFDAQVL